MSTPSNALNISSGGIVVFDGASAFSGNNLSVATNTLSSTNTNGNIILAPNGSGLVSINNAYTLPSADGTANYVLQTDGSGTASWAAATSTGGAWTQIQSQSASSSATLDFTTGFSSSYNSYYLSFTGLKPSSSADFQMQVSTNGGSTWISSSYQYIITGINSGGSTTTSKAAAASIFSLISTAMNASYNLSGEMTLFGLSQTIAHRGNVQFTSVDSGANTVTSSGGLFYLGSTTAINGLRFKFGSGNIASGTIILYGIT